MRNKLTIAYGLLSLAFTLLYINLIYISPFFFGAAATMFLINITENNKK